MPRVKSTPKRKESELIEFFSKKGKSGKKKKKPKRFTHLLKNHCIKCYTYAKGGEGELNPGQCQKSKRHRLCSKCWFDEFAIEGISHKCPGCLSTGVSVYRPGEIIELDDSD